jgi:hypothetical protein
MDLLALGKHVKKRMSVRIVIEPIPTHCHAHARREHGRYRRSIRQCRGAQLPDLSPNFCLETQST